MEIVILLVYGTRPEFIKIKPLINEMIKVNIKFKTLFTGQHQDLINEKADFNFEIKQSCDNRLDDIISSCLHLPDKIFKNIDYVLVQGDTTSALGTSLTAYHRNKIIIHLEAGLRTYDKLNPFPEEINRQLISRLASIHFCPTEQNKNNLLQEGIKDKIFVVGNTGLDNLNHYKIQYDNIILATLHRRENHNQIDQWFNVLNNLAKQYDYEFIIPMHPNPNVQKYKHILTNFKVIDPLSHDKLLEILVKSSLVITDSGGLQEECSFFNKKCLVCRRITERPESLGKTSFLVKEPDNLEELFNTHIKSPQVNYPCPFGDGKSAEKICNILKDLTISSI